MKDPEEKDEQAPSTNDNTANQQSDDSQATNWEETQQVDEEGNEIDPDDVL